ncbi:MAG: kelch repeat-containing protein, partial [Planctomycetota bacterium]
MCKAVFFLVVIFAGQAHAQGSWEPKAPMPTARFSVGFGTVNGRIYAVGGLGGNPHANIGAVERYDPATDSWATGLAPMPTARRDFGFSVA